MALSAAGFLIHNLREFGLSGLLAIGTGTVPVVIVYLVLLAAWWSFPAARRLGDAPLLIWALLHLVGGAILSVLPLGIFPFTPEQSLAHYISHLIYGLLQLPLLWASIRALRATSLPLPTLSL